jgi:hypothetical protein
MVGLGFGGLVVCVLDKKLGKIVIGHGIGGIDFPTKWSDSLKACCRIKQRHKLVTRSHSHSNRLMALRSNYVYMLIPICEQFHYAYGDPHLRTYQSLRKKSCRILLKIAKLVHMGILICIRARKGCTCGGISTKFAYGDPRMHNEIVCIWGATYTPRSIGNFYMEYPPPQ